MPRALSHRDGAGPRLFRERRVPCQFITESGHRAKTSDSRQHQQISTRRYHHLPDARRMIEAIETAPTGQILLPILSQIGPKFGDDLASLLELWRRERDSNYRAPCYDLNLRLISCHGSEPCHDCQGALAHIGPEGSWLPNGLSALRFRPARQECPGASFRSQAVFVAAAQIASEEESATP
jgi:hypothetical protein